MACLRDCCALQADEVANLDLRPVVRNAVKAFAKCYLRCCSLAPLNHWFGPMRHQFGPLNLWLNPM